MSLLRPFSAKSAEHEMCVGPSASSLAVFLLVCRSARRSVVVTSLNFLEEMTPSFAFDLKTSGSNWLPQIFRAVSSSTTAGTLAAAPMFWRAGYGGCVGRRPRQNKVCWVIVVWCLGVALVGSVVGCRLTFLLKTLRHPAAEQPARGAFIPL